MAKPWNPSHLIRGTATGSWWPFSFCNWARTSFCMFTSHLHVFSASHLSTSCAHSSLGLLILKKKKCLLFTHSSVHFSLFNPTPSLTRRVVNFSVCLCLYGSWVKNDYVYVWCRGVCTRHCMCVEIRGQLCEMTSLSHIPSGAEMELGATAV